MDTRDCRSSDTAPTPIAVESDIVRIAVFDDSPLFRAGVVHVLNAEPDLEVVLESGSDSAIRQLATELVLDIVILDSDLMAAGEDVLRYIIGVHPATRFLVMSHSPDPDQVLAIFAAGARGYILKRASRYEFVEAVRALHRNQGYMSPTLGAAILASASLAVQLKSAIANPMARLTFRESEIFTLLAAGLTNSEIGRRLDVTEKTIKHYVTGIFEKLNVRNRVEAAMLLRPGVKAEIAPRS